MKTVVFLHSFTRQPMDRCFLYARYGNPVQKLSTEAYRECMAAAAQALTALGNFWTGRKPLIPFEAARLGCDDNASDLKPHSLYADVGRLPDRRKLAEERQHLLARKLGTVVLDEAHKACRRGRLGETKGEPNSHMDFMVRIDPCTRNLLLGTTTPIQAKIYELWDLMGILDAGADAVTPRGSRPQACRRPALPHRTLHGRQDMAGVRLHHFQPVLRYRLLHRG
jgi:hypothetical protein